LDGLRALAVLAVLLYHLKTPWSALELSGGFFGVDVFFVLSGYLITSLLCSEWRGSSDISLSNFWLRRARRLLPAVIFLLAAVLLYALLFLPNEVASLRSDALASFAYVTNWYLIFHEQSYFESWGRPSLFQHLWSLAIEEQFYLIWPLLFAIGIRVLRPAGMLFATLCAALGATLLMAALYEPGVDPSRIYYGTDTRSAGLLIGSALAFVLPLSAAGTKREQSRLGNVLGLAGLAVLAYFVVAVDDSSALPYRGGFAVVSLGTAAVIASIVSSHSMASIALGGAALRTIGKRSYSIYLWHWPVFMLTRAELDVPFGGWPLVAMQLAIVAVLAEFSYRFVETPVRNGAMLGVWSRWRETLSAPALRSAGVSLAGASAVVFALAMIVALWRADAPASLSSSSSIGVDIPSRGIPVAAAPVEAAPNAATSATSELLATPGSTPTAASPATQTPARGSLHCTSSSEPGMPALCGTPTATAQPEAPSPVAEVVAPPRITAIGDSVMLGAAAQLSVGLGTNDIHAKVGMQASEGTELLRQLQTSGTLGDVVVVHLGNNGEFNGGQLSEMMEALKDAPLVIFVNLKVPRDWQENNNQMLAEDVGRYPNARLIDWYAQSEDQPQYFWDDGLHLRLEGSFVYTALILQQINADWPKLAAKTTS